MIKLELNKAAIEFHLKEVTSIFDNTLKDKFIERKRENKKEKIQINSLFLDFLEKNKNKLISSEPSELLKLHQAYLELKISDSDSATIKDFFINTGYKKFNNKVFLEKLGANTCVYCNRNYTLQIVNDRARAQLDHWFPKDTFYILALSLYNLIPSCQSCNHIKLKGNDAIKKICKNQNLTEKEINEWWLNKALTNLNHPYLHTNNFKFSYDYKSLDDFNLKINVETGSKSDNTLKFNRIEEIYNAHSNLELKDLVHLRSKYSNTFLNIVEKNFGGIMSKEEAYRIIFGVEEKEENFHKRPFSKFKTDIIEELLNDHKSKFQS
ncbi:hypothetical protein V3470_07585 [Flavobacterium oreochromis]|uniref:HNH endonuclease n=1 Tax=Flavobacterium oreochromis TaxID=2906078 RepID=A0ABW8P8Y7_9FLAO|nr:hypothetical protein [Flavobacterium oreochromis]OWP75892.1 hypothetical protein BWG23_09480 [Flavobacterium oreochromis]